MEARAHLKYARISPRKVKIVLDLIRRQRSLNMLWLSSSIPLRLLAKYLEKLLKSAMANAENNHNMDVSKLYVAECFRMPRSDSQENSCREHRAARTEF